MDEGSDADFQAWVREQLKTHDASHDFVHALNVAHLASKIGAQYDAPTRAAARYVALAHDICDVKYVRTEAARKTRARAVGARLRAHGVDEDVCDLVTDVLPLISYTRRRRRGVPDLCTDARNVYLIVSDADMLEAMGVTGLVRTHIFQSHRLASTRAAHDYIAANLFECADYMHHKMARDEATRRLAVMKLMCAEYERERQWL